jgi:two-component system sensor histidine kinase AlgZ
VHPFFTDRRWRLLHLVAWGITGEVVAVLLRTVFGVSWLPATLFGIPMGLVGGVLGLSAWYVLRATPARWTDRVRPLTTWLVAAVAVGLLWAALGQMWWSLLGRLAWVDVEQARSDSLSALLRGVGVLGYLLAVAAYRLMQALEASDEAARQALRAELARRDAELRALRAQIDPHFLFNSLNSIAGLTSADPARAREMCQRLADFFRQTTRLGEASRIPLEEEVALSEQYLRVEQVRFGPRLEIALAVDPDTTTVSVPPLLLQPLVENAVRHGIATTLDGGTITIETRRAGDRVVMSVSNPRDAEARRRGTGRGLDLVRRRLAAAFRDRASLAIDPRPDAFRVQVTIPVEESTP